MKGMLHKFEIIFSNHVEACLPHSTKIKKANCHNYERKLQMWDIKLKVAVKI